MMKCPECGAINEEDALFCIECGAKITLSRPESSVPEQPVKNPEETVYCPECGTANPPESRFCVMCGYALDGGSETATCPSCGKPVQGDEYFCMYCGTKLRDPRITPPAGMTVPADARSGHGSGSGGSPAKTIMGVPAPLAASDVSPSPAPESSGPVTAPPQTPASVAAQNTIPANSARASQKTILAPAGSGNITMPPGGPVTSPAPQSRQSGSTEPPSRTSGSLIAQKTILAPAGSGNITMPPGQNHTQSPVSSDNHGRNTEPASQRPASGPGAVPPSAPPAAPTSPAAPHPDSPQVRIVCREKNTSWVLKGPLTVGQGHTGMPWQDDSFLTERDAVITVTPDALHIEEISPVNPMFRLVDSRVLLSSGDWFIAGNSVFVYMRSPSQISERNTQGGITLIGSSEPSPWGYLRHIGANGHVMGIYPLWTSSEELGSGNGLPRIPSMSDRHLRISIQAGAVVLEPLSGEVWIRLPESGRIPLPTVLRIGSGEYEFSVA